MPQTEESKKITTNGCLIIFLVLFVIGVLGTISDIIMDAGAAIFFIAFVVILIIIGFVSNLLK